MFPLGEDEMGVGNPPMWSSSYFDCLPFVRLKHPPAFQSIFAAGIGCFTSCRKYTPLGLLSSTTSFASATARWL